jgi:hypothetical protein
MTTSVRMWVITKTDTKGVITYLNTSGYHRNGQEDWYVNLMFADFVGYDDAVVWRDYLTQFMTVDEALGYKIRPVTITLEEN